MAFYDTNHQHRILQLERLWNNLHDLANLAKRYGINDIFQDNGAKTLQQLIYLNMNILPGREGNDAISSSNIEWEMKSINLETSATGFSTNHHLNHDILAKYRQVPWTFSIYHGITLTEIYVMTPQMLEPQYEKWESMLNTKSHINNPKIPVYFVKENGIRVYPINQQAPIDPDLLVQQR